MGRKKRKKLSQPFCYYCNRNFDSEKVLIQHQKAKHFKCPNCHKKMVTAFALMNHMFQVHKESLKIVPNAREGRDSVELAIHGMQGVPDDAKREKEEQNNKALKKQKTEESEGESESEVEEKEAPAPAPAAAPESAAAPTQPAAAVHQPPNPFSAGTGYVGLILETPGM
jgi:predicted RNA-binding Zn-ribbon protein involved in translation (DUF1610 family)